jgi:hypothetical protein
MSALDVLEGEHTALWTWGGTYFGYRDGDSLWTHDGRKVGRFYGNEVFGPDGKYLGEFRSENLSRLKGVTGCRYLKLK